MDILSLPGGIVLGWCALEGETGHEAAYRLLREIYALVACASLPAIEKTKLGKPYFPDSHWHFSLSHTRRHAFCALSPVPIGIDAEEADRPIRLELAKKILSPGEAARLQEAEDPRKALLQFWVLKEAAAKCTGLGLRGYPSHTDFYLNDERLLFLDGCYAAYVMEETHHAL